MSTTGRKWTRLLLPLVGVVFALGEAAWHELRPANADLADLAAETALVRSQRAKLEARVDRIAAGMVDALCRASNEAQRSRIRLEAASAVDEACDLAKRNGNK